MPSTRVRILIADNHALIAHACKGLLEPAYDVVGIVSDGHALLKAARALHPQIILLDISMPLLNGLDAADQLAQTPPFSKIVFLTMHDDPDLVAEAFRRGASAYLLKTCGSAELFIALREVSLGNSYISPSIVKGAVRSFATNHRDAKLTKRQRAVVQLLAEGKTMKEAAGLLCTTIRTIAFHKYRAMASLSLKNGSDLVRYAIRQHIIEP